MTYLLLNLAFMAPIVIYKIIMRRWLPRYEILILTLVLLVLTAIFDNFIVGSGIVAYDPELISGVRIGYAPIEDFFYALAAVILIPSLWNWLRSRS
jgi:lycopene cyclase domain-containing protein